MNICRMIGEDYNHPYYEDCEKCSIRTCPVKNLMERVKKLENTQ